MNGHQCTAVESGGVQCELPAGHRGGHWISDQTVKADLAGNGVRLV